MSNSVDIKLESTTPEGVTVPVKLTVEWPDDQAWVAVLTMKELPKLVDDLQSEILTAGLTAGDTSILDVVAEIEAEEGDDE